MLLYEGYVDMCICIREFLEMIFYSMDDEKYAVSALMITISQRSTLFSERNEIYQPKKQIKSVDTIHTL